METLAGSYDARPQYCAGGGLLSDFDVDAEAPTSLAEVRPDIRARRQLPSAFSLDREGQFLFAAGSETDRLASYRVNGDTGDLTHLETYSVGKRPMWVLVTSFGG